VRYRIREVDDSDYAEELHELHRVCFDDGSPLVDFSEGHWWIAFLKDIPAAFIGVVQAEHFADAGYFIRVGVDPSHRGRGLQRRLMRAMEAKARKVGWHRIVTDTRDNPPSANNLIAAGYLTFSPSNAWASRLDAIYWTKEL
jgi:GNAT superfamily N-acetyltransferase